MTKKENRFIVSYVQDNRNETIIILKDKTTNVEYLEVISEKGIALTTLQECCVKIGEPIGE